MARKPTYRFSANIDGVVQDLHPAYDDDLTKTIERAQGRNHFTENLSGDLTFVRSQYDTIAALSIETEVQLTIYVIYQERLTSRYFLRVNSQKQIADSIRITGQ